VSLPTLQDLARDCAPAHTTVTPASGAALIVSASESHGELSLLDSHKMHKESSGGLLLAFLRKLPQSSDTISGSTLASLQRHCHCLLVRDHASGRERLRRLIDQRDAARLHELRGTPA
jgi:hypothetical protein